MKKYLLILILFVSSSALHAQPFQIGHTSITFTDSARNNRSIATEIYYPSDVDGDNVALTVATADKFPVLSFGHGFVMTWDAYQYIWEAVVPQGFIMAFPKTEGSLAPSHAEFAKDLVFVISQLKILGGDNTSLFFNRIDSMNTVMGHSMGGGSAFIAAQLSSEIKSLVTLAPAETNPSAIQAAASVAIPALIFAGGNDCVTPQATNQQPMYDSLISNCKTYISINGGSHCQMADNNFLCSIGEITCSPQPAITRSEQHDVIEKYLLPWLDSQLKNNCVEGTSFDSLITSDSLIAFQKTCVLCNVTTGLNQNDKSGDFSIYPNPFSDELQITSSFTAEENFKISIYSMDGRILFSKDFNAINEQKNILLNMSSFSAGIYFLKISSGNNQFMRKIVKR